MLPTSTNPNTDPGAVDTLPARRLFVTILLAWLAMLGFDFFLHAGLLARLYLDSSPFLLTPLEAFRRLPFGYLSFLLSATLLVWLMARLRLVGWRAGLGFGLKLGALIWGGITIGLFSISTAGAPLLAGWFLGKTVELGLAGAVAGGALTGRHIRRLSLKVAALILFLAIITIALQSFGLAPASGIPRE